MLNPSATNTVWNALFKLNPAFSRGLIPRIKPNTKPKLTANIIVLIIVIKKAVPIITPTTSPIPHPNKQCSVVLNANFAREGFSDWKCWCSCLCSSNFYFVNDTQRLGYDCVVESSAGIFRRNPAV